MGSPGCGLSGALYPLETVTREAKPMHVAVIQHTLRRQAVRTKEQLLSSTEIGMQLQAPCSVHAQLRASLRLAQTKQQQQLPIEHCSTLACSARSAPDRMFSLALSAAPAA